jgi:hypothetical protein
MTEAEEADGLEVWGVRDYAPAGSDGTECEPVLPGSGEVPSFWSVYHHVAGRGCMALTDHDTREAALEEAQRIVREGGRDGDTIIPPGLPVEDYTEVTA